MLRNVIKTAAIAAAIVITAPEIAPTPAQAAVGIEVNVGPERGPPKLRFERRGVRPHRGAVWQAGHWAWANGRYDWVGGVWADPPRARAAWIPGHWRHRGRNWVWVDGHWA